MTTHPLLDSPLPIVAAPMAGGPSSVALGAAVAAAGGFPILAAGYQTPEALAAQITAAREWNVSFGVNLFAPAAIEPDEAAFAAYVDRLRPDAARYDVQLDPRPRSDDDSWHEKLTLLLEEPVPVVSFTFGLPPVDAIGRLRRAGSIVLASVTTRAEASAAEAGGVDGLVVQGPRAGGHSATWNPRQRIQDRPTEQLVADVRSATRLPLLAAGGVHGPAAVPGLLTAGADAVVVGTLLLRTDEAGTSQIHRDALAARGDAGTVITNVFTGRPARAIRNGFIDRHDSDAPLGYPAVHHLTRELRRRAAAAGDVDRVHLWAGTGYRGARPGPVRQAVTELAALL